LAEVGHHSIVPWLGPYRAIVSALRSRARGREAFFLLTAPPSTSPGEI
jgi:hypothetical protein